MVRHSTGACTVGFHFRVNWQAIRDIKQKKTYSTPNLAHVHLTLISSIMLKPAGRIFCVLLQWFNDIILGLFVCMLND